MLELANFPAAPSNKGNLQFWRILGVIAVGLIAAGLAALPFSWTYAVALLALGIVDGINALFMMAFAPVGYVVRVDGLTIERRRWRPRVFTGPTGDIRRDVDQNELADAVRTFVTSSSNVVLLRVGEPRSPSLRPIRRPSWRP
ncbi:MAG: hypothetical protein ABI990_11955 [Actinomycetota bacterium]